MRDFIVLLSLLAPCCLAQQPHPCSSPPLMTGALTVMTQTEKMQSIGQYWYDALGQRQRIKEWGTLDNKTLTLDALLLYNEHTVFLIDEPNQKCVHHALKSDFHPMGIPQDATLHGQTVLGSSSRPGQGLLVNSWTGTLPDKSGNYMMDVTEFGCIPLSTAYHQEQYGWIVVTLFNNVIGLTDPEELDIPDFCQRAERSAEEGDEPATDFISLFLRRH